MFSYEHLLAFCTTYEEKSYSNAAKKLAKDRTTIREQIKALEDIYDVNLFEIIGKKASPTAAATHIYQRAKTLVSGTEKLNTTLDSIYNQELLHINIYHDISLPLTLAIKIEHAISQQLPELRVHWLHRNRDEALSNTEQGHNNVTIMQHRNMHSINKSLSFYSLGYGKLAAYTGRRNKLRHLNNLSLDDLRLEKQYISENHFNAIPELYAVSPHYHLISNNDLLLEMVKHDGWAIISKDIAYPLVKEGELFELKLDELATHLNFGLSLFYPMSLQYTSILAIIKEISVQHFNYK